jgi:transketolase
MVKTTANIAELELAALNIRKLIIKTIHDAGVGHTGGSLSEADILTALFFRVMNIDTKNPELPERDRFILSKGHSTPGYYATLAHRGFFPEDVLNTFDSVDSILQAHPDMNKVPGIDISSGSLGQGLSCGLGMAMAGADLDRKFRTYVLIGDGESTEGQLWEAILFAGAANKRVKRLIAIIDNNKVQLSSMTADVVDIGNIAAKYEAFGWKSFQCDGHNMHDLVRTLENAASASDEGPVVVVADTIKGKGVSFMEGTPKWHGLAPNDEEYAAAMAELNNSGAAI